MDDWDDYEELGDDEGPELDEPKKPPSNITQHTLLSFLASNFDIWSRVAPIIDPAYFDEQYRRVAQYLIHHTEEYRQIPSLAIIRMKTGVDLDNYGDAQDERTQQWLLDEVQTFARHRATELEIIRAAESIQKDQGRETLEEIFQNFKKITEINLEKDLGIEVHRDAAMILSMNDAEIIKPTKYVHLDRVTGGGFPCPGMTLLAGNAGRGKSVTLTNFAIQYCKQGDFVVYVSLELPEVRIFERIAAALTDTPIWQIHKESDRIIDTLGARLQIGDGLLRVKKMKMSGTTTSNINAYLKELYIKESIKPKVLILDYLDLLYPRARVRDLSNIHVKDKYVTEETYSLCEDWGILCLTASQMVKNNSEMDVFDHATFAGGTGKVNTVDYAISLERKEEELIMRIVKGRYGGENTQIPFFWNVNTLRISDGPDEKFYALNPRFDPAYQHNASQKTAEAMKHGLNKDARNAHNDQIMSVLKDLNTAHMGTPED